MLKVLDTSQKHVLLLVLGRLEMWLMPEPKEGKYEKGD